ncbi:MAG: ketoacyl-ACP synthase III, partial [Flavobacteriales bacterium]|nr:ketoacyl-ACP synthase III [Flavobacteriales bacterium]
VSENDKSTYPLFGDAGTATAIEWAEGCGGSFNLKSDGAGYETIIIRDGGIRNKVKPSSFDVKEISPGINRCDLDLEIDGLEVFNFSVTKVPKLIQETLEHTKSTSEDYDYFVMHQANLLMNEAIRRKLKINKEQTPYSLKDYGNTSSASIPLTICSQLNNEMEQKENKMLLCGFGVGLSWATLSIKCSPMICLPVITV